MSATIPDDEQPRGATRARSSRYDEMAERLRPVLGAGHPARRRARPRPPGAARIDAAVRPAREPARRRHGHGDARDRGAGALAGRSASPASTLRRHARGGAARRPRSGCRPRPQRRFRRRGGAGGSDAVRRMARSTRRSRRSCSSSSRAARRPCARFAASSGRAARSPGWPGSATNRAYEPDRIANEVLDDCGFDPPEPDAPPRRHRLAARGRRSGMRRAGFREVRAWSGEWPTRGTRSGYLAFFTRVRRAIAVRRARARRARGDRARRSSQRLEG